ncbi:Myb family transcription factor EFM [Sesamum angolense]|uniref:Myb family transcription factor EFM n=1 Tax=Sesamum angolense TaxID=2727404 RepID=A0AAE2BPW2_9LAMI|nr:Myb family transcription factor EFM [Sesamum angolense]
MGENSRQLNLDVGSIFVPKTISDILTEVSMMHDFSKKSSNLDFYVHSLEEEMRKVDAFKRELPHCMQLLRDAIETLKKESLRWKEREMGPVMEEFIPMKGYSEEGGRAKLSNDFSEKKNWMSSVQLWSTPVHYENQDSVLSLRSRHQEEEGSGFDSQFQGCNNIKNSGGAFVPFKKAPGPGLSIKEQKRDAASAVNGGLSLSIPVAELESESPDLISVKEPSSFLRPQLQQRKQRRCWSPELHKRFVDALQHLGGAQTATPKQIRELMKVDGLTNDEVKSHLQKYRLHIRKLPSTSGGTRDFSWLAQELPNKQVDAHSGSPQDHLNLGGSAKRGSGSATGGDSMEEDEDDKCES